MAPKTGWCTGIAAVLSHAPAQGSATAGRDGAVAVADAAGVLPAPAVFAAVAVSAGLGWATGVAPSMAAVEPCAVCCAGVVTLCDS